MPSLSQLRALLVHLSAEEVAYYMGNRKKSKENCHFKPYSLCKKSFKRVYKYYIENIILETGLTHLNVDTSKNQVDIKGISLKTKQTGLK